MIAHAAPECPDEGPQRPQGGFTMLNRLIRTAPAVLGLLVLANAAPALPPMGAFSIDLGGSYAALSTSDIEDIYAPLTLDNHKGSAFGFSGGVSYNVSESFQVGAAVEEIAKQYKVTWSNGDVDTWKMPALGILARLRWLMPMASPDLLFAISASAGQYRLSGASLKFTDSTWTYDFSGSTIGGALAIDSEYRLGSSVAAVALLGYRLATIKKVTYTLHPIGTSDTLQNGDGTNAKFDYTGPFLSLSLRFYFGGDGSSVTSQ
jgi:hypothetical protein